MIVRGELHSHPDDDIVRTLSIIRQMAAGKQLTLPSGRVLAMGTNMAIGYAYMIQSQPDAIIGDLTLAQLNELLTKHDIGIAIPSL